MSKANRKKIRESLQRETVQSVTSNGLENWVILGLAAVVLLFVDIISKGFKYLELNLYSVRNRV